MKKKNKNKILKVLERKKKKKNNKKKMKNLKIQLRHQMIQVQNRVNVVLIKIILRNYLKKVLKN